MSHETDVADTLRGLTRRAETGEISGALVVVLRKTHTTGLEMAPVFVGEIDPSRAVFACEMIKRALLEDVDRTAQQEQNELDDLRREIGLPVSGTVQLIPKG